MKRRYNKPVVEVIKINSSQMLCISEGDSLKFNPGEEVSTEDNKYSHDENYNIVW